MLGQVIRTSQPCESAAYNDHPWGVSQCSSLFRLLHALTGRPHPRYPCPEPVAAVRRQLAEARAKVGELELAAEAAEDVRRKLHNQVQELKVT